MGLFQTLTKKIFVQADSLAVLRTERIQGEIKEITSQVKNTFLNHYEGANENRLNNNWHTNISSISANIKESLTDLISRSISLNDNNLNATAVIDTLVTNIIGKGYQLYSVAQDFNGKPLKSVSKFLDASWAQYIEEWSSEGGFSWVDSLEIRCRDILVSGSTITQLTPSNTKNSLLPIANRLLSVLRLDPTKDTIIPDYHELMPPHQVFYGMILDQYAKAKGYYLKGVKNPLHSNVMKVHYFKNYAEQYIGLPILTPSTKYLWAIDQILADKLISSQIASKIALVIAGDPVNQMKKDSDTGNLIWESGSIMPVNKGEEPKIIQADDSLKTIVNDLIKSLQHIIAAGAGISYQAVTRDLNKTNMASARVNVNADQSTYRKFQRRFTDSVIKFDRENFVKFMFMSGKMTKFGLYYSDYLQNMYGFNKTVYQAPGFAMIDPKNETLSIVAQLEAKLTTRQKEYSKIGETYEKIKPQIDKEDKENDQWNSSQSKQGGKPEQGTETKKPNRPNSTKQGTDKG